MSATLNVNSSHVSFGDNAVASNPRLNYFSWLRRIDGVEVRNPRAEAFVIEPGQSKIIFDGARLSLTDSTFLDLTLSTVTSGRYRLAYASGTVPGFRTDRGVDLNGVAVTMEVLPNASLRLSVGSSEFSGVSTGDIVLIPSEATGDSESPFNALNVGYWRVLARTNTELTLVRLAGEIFEGTGEEVTVTDASQVQVFSVAGVQVGDKMEITDDFPVDVQKTFTVTAVTANWIEFSCTVPLPSVSGVPGGAVRFYGSGKRFLRIEVDQEGAVQLNGSTDLSNRLSPLIPADSDKVAWFEKFGPSYSLTIKNLSSDVMNVNVLTAE